MLRSVRLLTNSRGISSPLDTSHDTRHLADKSGSGIPTGLSKKLIRGSKTKFSIPQLEKSLSLGRNLGQVKLNPDDFFDMISKVKTKPIPKNSDVQDLIKIIVDLKQDSDMKLSKGVTYFKCFYLIVEEFERRAKEGQIPLQLEDSSLIYTQWLAYFMHNEVEMSHDMLKENLDVICDQLILDLEEYAKEYSKSKKDPVKDNVKKAGLQTTSVPKIFDPGNVEEFCTRLIDTNKYIFCEKTVYQILTYKSAALWNSGSYSKSLKNVGNILEFFTNNLQDEEIRVELGKHVLLVLSDILTMICENKMEPAVEYLDVILQRINNKVPIIPYLMSLHYGKTSELETKSLEIFKNYPKIAQLEDAKVDKSLTNKDSARVNTMYFVSEMLKRIDLEQFSDPEDKIVISPETMQHMTDITILEFLQAGKFAEAISVMQRDGLLPTMNVIEMLVRNICDEGQLYQLENLRHVLPIDSDMYEFVCEQEVKHKTKEIYSLWASKMHSKALEKMLEIYTLVVENEYQVSDELVNKLMRNILLYLKLFIEMFLFELDQPKPSENWREPSDLKTVNTLSKTMILAHENYDLRAIYWETYFFSDKYHHQAFAEEMFQKNPQLPRHLDYDHLLVRAQKYEKESYFRKLLEISLQFDLGEYEQSMSFDNLLIFYCLRGNLKMAGDTLARSQSIGIPISADAMKIYLDLRDFNQKKRESSIFYNISELFKSSSSDKK